MSGTGATSAFSHIIVGGGAAGCVMASRLSERSSHSVLLIEAGSDTKPGQEPPDTLDSYPIVAYFNRIYHWTDLRVYLNDTQAKSSRSRRYEQARVMGGGTTINGMFAVRGLPADYDEWAQSGADGWGWESILPYFKKLERDLDFPGHPLHGADGPLPIRRIPKRAWSPFTTAVADAMEMDGYQNLQDHNASNADGYFPMSINNVDGQRFSAARAYLTAEVRSRPNLRILARTNVRSILFAGRQATGVSVKSADGTVFTLSAKTVILCAGALQTPALLMRAGIGPASHLAEHNIDILADRVGVGQNLQDHPMVALAAYLKPESRLPANMRRHIQMGMRYSSGHADCPPGDMFVLPSNRAAWHPLGKRLASLLVCVNKTYSTGEVRLAGAGFDMAPEVNFRQLSDERDLIRLELGLAFLWELMNSAPVKATVTNVFPASFSDTVRSLGAVNRTNHALTGLVAGLMSFGSPIRKLIIENLISRRSIEDILASRETLRAYVVENATGSWHCCGTARMGRADQPGAVVDPDGRVIGVGNLRVVDASVMPSVISANTMLTTMAVAEKISHAMLSFD